MFFKKPWSIFEKLFCLISALLWISGAAISQEENTSSVAVNSIRVTGGLGDTRLHMDLSEGKSFEVTSENESTVVISIPEGTTWNAQKSGQGEGLVQNYTYEQYDDGSGQLVINLIKDAKLNKSFIVSAGTGTPQFVLDFRGEEDADFGLPQFTNLRVNDIRFIEHGIRTFVILDLNEASTFMVSESVQYPEVNIKTPAGTSWSPPAFQGHVKGLVEAYHVQAEKTGSSIVNIAVKENTIVETTFPLDVYGPTPRYVISLVPRSAGRLTDQNIIHTLKVAAAGLIDPQPNAEPKKTLKTCTIAFPRVPIASGPLGLKDLPPNAVQSVNIGLQGGDTILHLGVPEPLNFYVTEDGYLNRVMIHVPEMSWNRVNVMKKAGGVIQSINYDPPKTGKKGSLLLKVEQGTHVIAKKVVRDPKSGQYVFMLYLSPNPDAVPKWLIEAANVDEGQKFLGSKYIKAQELGFRGGFNSYADLGHGFYLGGLVGYNVGESSVTLRDPYLNNPLAVDSKALGAFIGYGSSTARFYYGGEISGFVLNSEVISKGRLSVAGTTTNFLYETNYGAAFEGSIRLGYYADTQGLFYIRAGLVRLNINHKSSVADLPQGGLNGKFSQSTVAALFGTGMDVALNDRFFMRFDYRLYIGNNLKLENVPFAAGGRITETAYYKPTMSMITMGVGYATRPMSGPSLGQFTDYHIPTGFYIGANQGTTNYKIARQINYTIPASGGTFIGSWKNMSVQPIWGLIGGYSTTLGKRGFFALDFTYFPGKKDTVLKYENQLNSTNSHAIFSFQDRTAITVRPGYIITHGNLLYFKLGVSRVLFRYRTNNTNLDTILSYSQNANQNLTGVVGGIGMEMFMHKSLSLRSEVTYDYYPKKVSLKNSNSTTNQTGVYKASNTVFTVGITYTFA